MSKLINIISKIEEKILIYSLAFNTLLVFAQVIMRYVFSNSLSWSEELARYIFLWQIWIGASFAISAKKHLKIDIFVEHFHGATKKILIIVSHLLFLFFTLFLAVKGTQLLLWVNMQEQLSPAMQMPMAFAYAAIPVGGFLMSIKIINEIHIVFNTKGNS